MASPERPRGNTIKKLAPLVLPAAILLANAGCDIGIKSINFPKCIDNPQPKSVEGVSTFLYSDHWNTVSVGNIDITKGNNPGEFNSIVNGKDTEVSNLPNGGIVFVDERTGRTISVSGKISVMGSTIGGRKTTDHITGTMLMINSTCPDSGNKSS